MRNINKIIIAAIGCAALAFTGGSAWKMHEKYAEEQNRVRELEEQLTHLSKKEKQTAVMQSVNAQMEELANEQRIISDEQREQAEKQSRIANEMRLHAEKERQNALVAEKRALEASQVAKSQQAIAERERSQAEYSKRVADTLSYISLSQSLANTAITQYQAGNHEIADLLANVVCEYTNRYHGDIYHPRVYQALALTSQNKTVWNKHKGSVTDIAFADEKQGFFVSCSTYGEVIKHTISGNKLSSTTLISDPRYDFRDVFINRNTNAIYALSRTGELLVFKGKAIKNVKVNIEKLKGMDTANDQFVLFGEQGMALFDTEKEIILAEKRLPFVVEFYSRYQNYPVIFDRQGRMHMVKRFSKLETTNVPVKGQVTAFAESKNQKTRFYGMSDGAIYFINSKGKVVKLVGHRSRISRVKINGHRLASSSYDGTVNMWMTNLPKIEPMTLFTTKGWVINFTFDLKKNYIWAGDQGGNLTRALISVQTMQQQLKAKLKRDLTREEWNYYIGRNVPYETFIRKEAKP